MNKYEYSDLHVGMEEAFQVRITEEMLQNFLNITNDINPLHNDEEYAHTMGYKNKVVYGMCTASFLSTLAGVYLPGEKSLIQSVETKFCRPVFVGDILTIVGAVCELNDTVQQIVLAVKITNQKDEKVLRGKMKIGVLHGQQ